MISKGPAHRLDRFKPGWQHGEKSDARDHCPGSCLLDSDEGYTSDAESAEERAGGVEVPESDPANPSCEGLGRTHVCFLFRLVVIDTFLQATESIVEGAELVLDLDHPGVEPFR